MVVSSASAPARGTMRTERMTPAARTGVRAGTSSRGRHPVSSHHAATRSRSATSTGFASRSSSFGLDGLFDERFRNAKAKTPARSRSVSPRRWQAVRVVPGSAPAPAPVRAATAFLVAAIAVASCSGSKHNAATNTSNSDASRSTKLLVIGSFDLESAGTPPKVSDATKNSVLAMARKYVEVSVLDPLTTGRMGTGYSTLFDPGVRAAAIGPDKAALTDLEIGKTRSFDEQASPVALSALSDAGGAILYFATKFSLEIKATRADGPVTIKRSVELTFAPSGKSWLVTAYRVSVARTTPQATTTTTAHRSGGTSP